MQWLDLLLRRPSSPFLPDSQLIIALMLSLRFYYSLFALCQPLALVSKDTKAMKVRSLPHGSLWYRGERG